jgi:glutathione S-transferase
MSAPVTLYHAPQSRSSCVLWMLEEIGQLHSVEVIDFRDGRHRTPAFLAVNPLGKVPALVHGGEVMTETGAILTYLADAFPEATLAPLIGARDRGAYLRWMFFYAASFEPAIIDRALKREPGMPAMSPYGTFDAVVETAAKALEHGPFLLGERLTASDVLWGSGLAWAIGFGLVPERAAFTRYLAQIAARPAYQRAQMRDAAYKDALV